MNKSKKLKPAAQLRKVLEQTGRKASQLPSLQLNGVDLAQFPQQFIRRFKEFSAIQSLSLMECSIRTLNKIPDFLGLKFLDLTNNCIKDDQIPLLIRFKSLVSLNLSMNQIENISVYRHLSKLFYLQILDLFDNPITYEDTYREAAFEMINKLKSLDGQDLNGHVVDELSDFEEDVIHSQCEQDDGQEPVKVKRKRRTKKEVHTYDESEDEYSQAPYNGRK